MGGGSWFPQDATIGSAQHEDLQVGFAAFPEDKQAQIRRPATLDVADMMLCCTAKYGDWYGTLLEPWSNGYHGMCVGTQGGVYLLGW